MTARLFTAFVTNLECLRNDIYINRQIKLTCFLACLTSNSLKYNIKLKT